MSGAIHILGAGGHAKTVVMTAVACGYTDIVLFDDHPDRHGTDVLGYEVRGDLSESQGNAAVFAAIGDNHLRQRVAEMFHEREWARLVHPQALVDESVFVAPGVLIAPMAVVNPDTRIDAHSIINTGAVVEHDCRIGHFVHIAPQSCLTGGVSVGDWTLIGAGSTVLPLIQIGASATIGAGATVCQNVDDEAVVLGTPAKTVEK